MYGFSPVWIRIWRTISALLFIDFPQYGQTYCSGPRRIGAGFCKNTNLLFFWIMYKKFYAYSYGFVSRCLLLFKCAKRDAFWLVLKLHLLQVNGFSPVWTRIWRTTSALLFITLPQYEQAYCCPARRIGTGFCKNINLLFFKLRSTLNF